MAVVTELFTASCCPLMIETRLYEKPWMLNVCLNVNTLRMNENMLVFDKSNSWINHKGLDK